MQKQTMMAAYYPTTTVTTDHIQQYLDENKSLILKIVESQNSGKLNECAENQARLQRNLMYLAAIADSQPQPPTMHHPQFASGGGMMQSGPHYLQHQQVHQQISTAQSLMAARSPMLYGHQSMSAPHHLGMSSGATGGLHILPSEAHNAAGYADFARGLGGGNKNEFGGSLSMDGRSGSSGGDGGETLYLKSGDDGN
ncbi:unnamed protein product [Cuscuta epithymum]|uniref:SS18 N-terminal domain-containing protein n=1 Tax=Cuscuta epithymum TaxID=186058 RepID=A0AAV0GFR8_9ASTE|nr:unnamed protein product [Cuscuta epithymum]